MYVGSLYSAQVMISDDSNDFKYLVIVHFDLIKKKKVHFDHTSICLLHLFIFGISHGLVMQIPKFRCVISCFYSIS